VDTRKKRPVSGKKLKPIHCKGYYYKRELRFGEGHQEFSLSRDTKYHICDACYNSLYNDHAELNFKVIKAMRKPTSVKNLITMHKRCLKFMQGHMGIITSDQMAILIKFYSTIRDELMLALEKMYKNKMEKANV
jgi:hypothetical protein